MVNGSVTEGYTYDAVGNRLTSAGPTSYNYNSSNELTSDSAATFTYDNNGNTTSKTDSTGNDLLHLGFREPPHQRDPAGNGRDRQLQVRPVWKKD